MARRRSHKKNEAAEAVKGTMTYGPLPAAPAALARKSAPENEVVRWVADNIDNPKPTAKSCPSPFAWTLLRQCREEGMTFFFIEKLWSKLVSLRSDEDQGAVKVLDGAPTVALIDEIMAQGNEIEEEAPEADAKVIPNAFAKYNLRETEDK